MKDNLIWILVIVVLIVCLFFQILGNYKHWNQLEKKDNIIEQLTKELKDCHASN